MIRLALSLGPAGGLGLPTLSLSQGLLNVINTLIFLIGAISILMIIIGGLRYVLSAGNPQATKGAKDTVLYAVIGVVVAISAYGIVSFIADRIR